MKAFEKTLKLLTVALVMSLFLVGCGDDESAPPPPPNNPNPSPSNPAPPTPTTPTPPCGCCFLDEYSYLENEVNRADVEWQVESSTDSFDDTVCD